MTSAITNQNNPYIIGRPIYEPEYFFGREDLFSFIQDNLIQKSKVILLHGQRRIGKSSILAHIPNFVKLDEFVFVNLSLEGRSQKPLNNVLYELALDIIEYLEDEYQLSAKHINISSTQNFQEFQEIFTRNFLPQVYKLINNKNLVLLLDEFDVLSKSSQDVAAEHFFPYLQSIINTQENLYVIPVIGRQLDDLPNLLDIFHQAPNKRIGLLDKNNTERLIVTPVKNILIYENEAINKILELSAGHPYFTQVICFALFSQARETEKTIITQNDVENIIDRAIEIGEAGLVWFRDGLSLTERAFVSVVAEIQNKQSTSDIKSPLDVLINKDIIITESLKEIGAKLIKGNFLNTSEKYPYYITIELVRLWLDKQYRHSSAVEELENLYNNIVNKYVIPSRVLTKIQEAKDKHYTELDLSNHWNTDEKNKLNKIPDEVFELKWLEFIKLDYNTISALPQSLDNLENLVSINLKGNQLSELPASLGNLSNLTELDLSENQLSKLPESLSNLTNLKSLNLSENQLSELPESLGNLSSLTDLNLEENKLSELPESLGNLSSLTELNISENKLSELPESLGNLSNLESLKLTYNQLISFHKSLGNLSDLKLLNLSNNKLSELPESLGNLTRLTKLYISENQLSRLPESFGNLMNLTHLNLSENQLSKLPESFDNLINLTHLNLSGNNISSFPKSFDNLTNLINLNLLRNNKENQNAVKIMQNYYENIEGDYVDTSRNMNKPASINISGAGSFNLGDISKAPTNSINNLPDFDHEPEKKELIALAIQLENDISIAELNDKDKEETLEQIKAIIETLKDKITKIEGSNGK